MMLMSQSATAGTIPSDPIHVFNSMSTERESNKGSHHRCLAARVSDKDRRESIAGVAVRETLCPHSGTQQSAASHPAPRECGATLPTPSKTHTMFDRRARGMLKQLKGRLAHLKTSVVSGAHICELRSKASYRDPESIDVHA
jgi:hypothetical protein